MIYFLIWINYLKYNFFKEGIYFNELIKDHPEIISNYPMLFVDCEIHELEE